MESSPILARRKEKAPHTFGFCVASAAVFSLLIFLLLSLVTAAVLARSEDPTAYVLPVAYALALFSAFLSGFLAARKRGRQGLFCGLSAGTVLALLFIVLFFVFLGDTMPNIGGLLLFYFLFPFLAALGGLCGAKKRVPRRRRRSV